MLVFNEELHRYTLNGKVIPSVTTIIGSCGLNDFSHIDPVRLKQLAYRGTMVHTITQMYDNNELDESSVDERLTGFLEGWKKFRKENPWEICMNEQKAYNKKYLYAGTLDRAFVIDGKKVVVDIKTGDYKPVYDLQLAAYSKFDSEDFGFCEDFGYVVSVKDDGTYKKTKCELLGAWRDFVAAVTINKLKTKLGIKK